MQMPLFIVDAELLKESTLLPLANTLKVKKKIQTFFSVAFNISTKGYSD